MNQAGVKPLAGKAHPLGASLKDANVPHSPVDNCESGEDGEGMEEAEDVEEEEGGGFSGIKMESVQDIIAKARFAESFLKGTPTLGLGENLEELIQLVDEEQKESEKPYDPSYPGSIDETVDHNEESTNPKEENSPLEIDNFEDLDENELDKVVFELNIIFLFFFFFFKTS